MGKHGQRDLFCNGPADQPQDVEKTRKTCETVVETAKNQSPKSARKTSPKRKSLHEAVYLTVKEVAAWYNVSVATIWRWHRTNRDFPRGHKLSAGSTRWLRSELEAFDEKIRDEKS